MIRPLCKDPMILSKVSSDATKNDLMVALDLLDTLMNYQDCCIGMAANMIGVNKRIIAFYNQNTNQYQLMLNPKIVSSAESYETQEGCLCLSGVRGTTRYKSITVEYLDLSFKKKKEKYSGLTAQTIQHEIDMTNGILI